MVECIAVDNLQKEFIIEIYAEKGGFFNTNYYLELVIVRVLYMFFLYTQNLSVGKQKAKKENLWFWFFTVKTDTGNQKLTKEKL